MLENRDDLMSIVVLEAGAAWPTWLTEYQRLAPNALVIAQAKAETLDTFSGRVAHRVAEAAAGGKGRVRVGAIVCSDLVDREALALREGVARTILKAMGSSDEAELVIAGDGPEDNPSRHELFALAGALCEELGGTGVNVRVRFTTGKSGMMRSVIPGAAGAEPEHRVAKGSG
ncbi:MAG: hypothetical protein H7Y32_15865 [Chloroflexales bacterium]|nr:hypothetical protein [Chloroflexales bacterium]